MCIHGELHEDSRMCEQDMKRFAILCGFTGTSMDWTKEFRSMCARYYWNFTQGPDLEQFRLFLVDPVDSRYQISPLLVELFIKVRKQLAAADPAVPSFPTVESLLVPQEDSAQFGNLAF